MEADIDDFGVKPPPPSDAIRDILNRYPDGQIFKEIIQNADDAGAKTVHFYVDHRHHAGSNLLHPKLKKYQGPSLIAYNDAKFDGEDWKGIQTLQRSVKADDPFKVGKFGIGFNSVYHLTDIPMIVSGESVAFFEPQMKIWKGKSGKKMPLDIIRSSYRNHLLPLNGICGFSANSRMTYPHTFFRFPLRTEPSDISNVTYSTQELLKRIDVLKNEAEILLLFLRSVESVKVYEINDGQYSLHSPLFEVEIDKECLEDLQKKRDEMKRRLHLAHYRQSTYGITNPVGFTTQILVKFTIADTVNSSHWLVSNQVGCSNSQVQELANKEKVFPWVGVATNLTAKIKNGRIFCTLPMPPLPMPLDRRVSVLPVHVNGTFSLSDNRRTIKWPEPENENDNSVKWNIMLVERVMPSCYESLLEEAKNIMSTEEFYELMPSIDRVQGSNWEGLLRPLYSSMFNRHPSFMSTTQQWTTKKGAMFVSEEEPVGPLTQSVLTTCGYNNIVILPPCMWSGLKMVNDDKDECSLKMVTPSFVRGVLRDNESSYCEESEEIKLELLQFCLRDKDYEDLYDIRLLPLASGDFECFRVQECEDCERYVCNEKNYPQTLLPNAEAYLINIKDESIHRMIEDLAESGETQVEKLKAKSVAKLLDQAFPRDWQGRNGVSLENSTFSLDWFEIFWNWLKNHKLHYFIHKHIIPIAHDSSGIRSVIKLKRDSNVVCVKKNLMLTSHMVGCFSKLGIPYTLCKYVPYLKHRELDDFLSPFNPKGVLNAIPPKLSSRHALLRQEAMAFQQFFVSHDEPMILWQYVDKLSRLPIYLTRNYHSLPLSIQTSNKKVIVEPDDFDVVKDIESFLPPTLVILSRYGNQQFLLKLQHYIEFPTSACEFIIKHIFPLIRQNEFFTNSTPPMQIILRAFDYLSGQSRCFKEQLGNLKFLQIRSILCSPNTLFDPAVSELKDIFQGKDKFPVHPFDEEEYLHCLRKCGLKREAGGQDLYDVLIEVSSSSTLKNVGSINASRVKAVFAYIQNHKYCLQETVMHARIRSSSRIQSVTRSACLGEALCDLARVRCVLPIESSRPGSYPSALTWKGSGYEHYLTKMTDSVFPCGKDHLCSLSNIMGSQVHFVICPSDICSRLVNPYYPPIGKVVEHLMTFVAQCQDNVWPHEGIIYEIYDFLVKHISDIEQCSASLMRNQWIWLDQKFVQPSTITLKLHPDCPQLLLTPYFHVFSGNEAYFDLFHKFGAHKVITDCLLVSVLKRISENDCADPQSSLRMVHGIFNWLTQNGNASASSTVDDLRNLYVPVQSKGKALYFVHVDDVVYIDKKIIRHLKARHEYNVIHDDFQHLAHKLGTTPLSERLGLVDAFEDVGQNENLIERINNILTDYKDGLTIIKELIQNAEDAGATEVNICHDARFHNVDEDLFFEGMAKAHGPALIVHNNSEFSDDDFKNIQKLGGRTKKDQPLKIGKFGLGFCSVYHLTDVPSFVSRDRLFIFDPTLSYLDDAIDGQKRGKAFFFSKKELNSTGQMKPYVGLFGFQGDKPYPKATMFRLPFRTPTSLSGISTIRYNMKDVDKLVADMKEAGPTLLLFMKNVKSVTFSRIQSDESLPTQLLKLSKEVSEICLEQIPGSEEPISLSEGSGEDLDAISDKYIASDTDEETDYSEEEDDYFEECYSEEEIIVICHKEDGEMSVINSFSSEEQPETSAREVQITISNYQERKEHHHWLVAECVSTNHISAVACKIDKIPHGQSSAFRIHPEPVKGEVFCFLPLRVHSGLPVHVSANFAVSNDRTGIHHSDIKCESEESLFNISLMEKSIPRAYHKLLMVLKELCQVGRVEIGQYEFSSLWPTSAMLEVHNPWDKFLPKFYKLLLQSELCYSQSISEWRCMDKTELLFHDILQSNLDVTEVLHILRHPLINLPSKFHPHLETTITACTVTEDNFLKIFFDNIEIIPTDIRNNVLLALVQTFAIRLLSTTLEKWIKHKHCIPCAPDGTILKCCHEIVDFNENSTLYNPEDGVFAVKSFQESEQARITMLHFGMMSTQLPWNMIIEKAKTIMKLYRVDRGKALQRVQILLHLIEKNLKEKEKLPLEITEIPFLPVLKRPSTYPQEMSWKGGSKDLSSCSELLDNCESLWTMAGSEACFVSTKPPSEGGCGEISQFLLKKLKISERPSVNMVIKQLLLIAEVSSSLSSKDRITEFCIKIYKFLDEELSKENPQNHSLISKVFQDSSNSGLVWTGSTFVHHDKIAKNWNHNGPLLYCLPFLLKSGMSDLITMLEIKEDFDKDLLCQALCELKERFGEESLGTNKRKMVSDLAKALADKLEAETVEASKLDEKQVSQEEIYYLPDTNLCMRNIEDLAYNDDPDITMEEEEVYFLYEDIPLVAAKQLGVQSGRSRTLDKYDSSKCNIFGREFGQTVSLIKRIKDILKSYTHSENDETILKELLQNADDAMATKLYFMVDERHHGEGKLLSDEWKDLQGPAFLVWNDKGFSDADFAGIQDIGQSWKRTDRDSTGKYGIGFNAVYHLTDCPSFYTNNETLCILDPHCRYVPGASQDKPGRMMDVDQKFWRNWSGLKSPFLQENLKGCPDEVRSSGTLFRFPLRHTEDLCQKSELIDSDHESSVLTASVMESNLQNWAPRIKEALLFLKHVTELRFFVISKDSKVTTTHHFRAQIDQHICQEIQGKSKKFSELSPDPFTVFYKLKLIDETSDHEQNCEEWLVQQGMGDINNPSQHWEFLSDIKPRHGIAYKTGGMVSSPRIFCSLPLHSLSKLPAHVNGNFILNSSGRSTLWQSRNPAGTDSNKTWNMNLIEALASSYATFLVECGKHVLLGQYSERLRLKGDIDQFYTLFPRWLDISSVPEGEMKAMAKHTYKMLGQYRKEVLISIRKETSPHTHGNTYCLDWQPAISEDKLKQVYFWPPADVKEEKEDSATDTVDEMEFDHLSLEEERTHSLKYNPSKNEDIVVPILKQIGMLFTVAPDWVRKHFLDIEFKIDIPEAKPESVYQYYKSYHYQFIGTSPCSVGQTPFRNIESFKIFIQYVIKKEHLETKDRIIEISDFPSSPFDYPLLLTSDGMVRKFNEENKVIASKFSNIFHSNSQALNHNEDTFLHPAIVELNINPIYFLEPSLDNWDLVKAILSNLLSGELYLTKRLKFASSFININEILVPLWQCMRKDPVFKEHVGEIVREWALILSLDGHELFLYEPNFIRLMPLTPPQKPRTKVGDSWQCEDTEEFKLQDKLFNILKANKMPIVHESVLKSHQFCPNFEEPASILSNFYHLYTEKGELFSHKFNINNHIDAFFEYFKQIKFDSSSLHHIKSLPLFEDIDGNIRSLSNSVYFWPDHISMVGLERILQESSTVFLKPDGLWTRLATADTLGIKKIDPLSFYVEYVFPHFDKLNQDECIKQLEHIRDTEELFNAAEEYSEFKSNAYLKSIGEKFLDSLKTLPFIERDDGGKKEYLPVSRFCFPEKDSVFELFPENCVYLPHHLRKKRWLIFLEKIGLHKEPTKEEFISFCNQISKGEHDEIKRASNILLKNLFSQYDWHSDEEFLCSIKGISYVCTEALEGLSGIAPASTTKVIKERGISLVSLENIALYKQPDRWNNHVPYTLAPLIWTVLPVVRVPAIAHPPVNPLKNPPTHREIIKNEKTFLQYLGICFEPEISTVFENLRSISESRFSSSILFERNSQNRIEGGGEVLDNAIFNILVYLSIKADVEQIINEHLLRDIDCIPVKADETSVGNIILVKPLQVVCNPREAVRPYLFSLATKFHRFQNILGVRNSAEPENIIYALKLINEHTKTSLSDNNVTCIKTLLKLLYYNYDDVQHCHTVVDEVLYLPTNNNTLSKSTSLIFNDKGCYKQEEFNFPDREYQLMSLLCSKGDEFSEYSFRMSDFVSKLPFRHSPIKLSSCSSDKLHSSCKPDVNEPSSFVTELKDAFLTENIAEIVEVIISHNSTEIESCKKFASSLTKIVERINVAAVKDLRVDIVFEKSSPPYNIGTAKVNVLLLKCEPIDGYTLYVDSEASAFQYKVPAHLMECMANEAFRLSGVERAKIKDPEGAIHLALQAKTDDDLKAILSEKGITSDLRMKRPEPMKNQPEPNRELAEIWIGQAKYDVQAMEVMYQAAKNNNKLSALVCFLAHQVAEKSVKAALAAKIGFSCGDLVDHHLFDRASKVKKVDSSLEDLPSLVRQVDHYYIRPRYPNQCEDRIPSESFPFFEAEKAFNIGREIFDLVRRNL